MKFAKAAVFKGENQLFELRELEVMSPKPRTVGLELISSGICGTDIHIHRGNLELDAPMIIGHEFVGRVDAISNEDSIKYNLNKGDHALVYVASPCGECLLCRNGDDANCVNMGVTYVNDPTEKPYFFGGYAEYNFSPVENCIKIPAEFDPKTVSAFSCAGPTAIHAFSLAQKANISIEKTKVSVVQGAGPVGLFAVMFLASLGVKNIVVITTGKNKIRKQWALRFGATEVLELKLKSEEEILQHIKSLNDGQGADLVFEASGNPKAFAQGLGLLRNRGVYLVPGQYSNSGKVEIAPEAITFGALQIFGSSQYSKSDIFKYFEFLKENPNLFELINDLTCEYALEDVNEAIKDVANGKNIKTVLVQGRKK